MMLGIFYLCLILALSDGAEEDHRCTMQTNHYSLNFTVDRCLLNIRCDRDLSENSKLNIETTLKVEDDVDIMLTDIDRKVHIMCEPTKGTVMYKIINAAELYLSDFDLPLTWSEVHEVNISHNNLLRINDNTFGKLEKVTVMDLSHNDIESISQFAFVNTDGITISIKMLLLQDNNLRNMDNIQFSPEITLEYLDISHNNIETLLWLEKSVFNNIVTINAEDNKFTFIGTNFKHMTKLIKLRLRGNSIKFINPFAFSQLNYLKFLDLSLNNIETLQPSMFDGLHSLLYLNISHNKVDGITEEYFSECRSLKVLDLSHNNLGQLRLTHYTLLAPIDYLLINDNNLSESDIADVIKFPFKVRKLRVGGNNFNCRHLIYTQAKEMVHKNLKTHPKERSENIEIDCSTSERVEVFGVSPRAQASSWNLFPDFANEYSSDEDSDFLREVLSDQHSILIEIKLHNFNNNSDIITVNTSRSAVNPRISHISTATIAWLSVVMVFAVLAVSFGYFVWKRNQTDSFGWRILGR